MLYQPACGFVCKMWASLLAVITRPASKSRQLPSHGLSARLARESPLTVLKWWACYSGRECAAAHGTSDPVAKGGHLDVLQWAHARGCPWWAWTPSYAAQAGHLTVIRWLRANGCPWNRWVCDGAARIGRLEWARGEGCPWGAHDG
jgi:hypothetical protein